MTLDKIKRKILTNLEYNSEIKLLDNKKSSERENRTEQKKATTNGFRYSRIRIRCYFKS
jgi:hypothetical protein